MFVIAVLFFFSFKKTFTNQRKNSLKYAAGTSAHSLCITLPTSSDRDAVFPCSPQQHESYISQMGGGGISPSTEDPLQYRMREAMLSGLQQFRVLLTSQVSKVELSLWCHLPMTHQNPHMHKLSRQQKGGKSNFPFTVNNLVRRQKLLRPYINASHWI